MLPWQALALMTGRVVLFAMSRLLKTVWATPGQRLEFNRCLNT